MCNVYVLLYVFIFFLVVQDIRHFSFTSVIYIFFVLISFKNSKVDLCRLRNFSRPKFVEWFNSMNLTGCTIEWIIIASGENVFVRMDTSIAHFISYSFDFAHYTQKITTGQFGQLFNGPSHAQQLGKESGIFWYILQTARCTIALDCSERDNSVPPHHHQWKLFYKLKIILTN